MLRASAGSVLRFALPAIVLALPVRSHAQTPAPLKQVGDMIVGRWMGEVTWAVDYPGVGRKGEKVTSYSVCRWTADNMGIECEDLSGKATGKSLVWYDASAKIVRQAGFDSGGNWSMGTLTPKGTTLVFESAGSFADGRKVQYKGETTFQDGGNTQIAVGATILDGKRNEFRDVAHRVGN
jgi:hypothetical protein